MKLLKCPICGNVVEMVEDHGVPLMCCGKKMEEIKADSSIKKVTLTSDDEPVAKFNIAGKSGKATVYEYCNLHGLWKTEIEL